MTTRLTAIREAPERADLAGGGRHELAGDAQQALPAALARAGRVLLPRAGESPDKRRILVGLLRSGAMKAPAMRCRLSRPALSIQGTTCPHIYGGL